MVELAVADLAVSMAWYRDRLRLTVELHDAARGFALLGDGRHRLALKQGPAVSGNVKLAFQVDDLEAERQRLAGLGSDPEGPLRVSHEGYQSLKYRDPDGIAVELFEWQ
jgi:catechol 2,3-dioxygenase-like lactoylglutathione lyase family enzyme